MDLDPLQVFLFVFLINVSFISANDWDFRRNLIRSRLRPQVMKKELSSSRSSSEGKYQHDSRISEVTDFLLAELRRVKVKRRRHPGTSIPSLVKASLSSPPLYNDTQDFSFAPHLKPFAVNEAVGPKPDMVKRCKMFNTFFTQLKQHHQQQSQQRKKFR